MRQFTVSRTLFGEDIILQAFCFDTDLHVSLYGGHRPHIGAISVGSPEGQQTISFPGHKEDVICSPWCSSLLERGFAHVVVEAGIHYDGLTPEGIQAVLDLTEDMQREALDALGPQQTNR